MQTVSSSDRLVTDHLPYTAAVTQDLLSRSNLRTVIPTPDAVAYGHVGLMEAASRYRPDNGASFATFSYSRIRGAVLDGIRRSLGEQRLLVARDEEEAMTRAAISVSRGVAPSTRAFFDPTELLDNLSLRSALLTAIRALTNVERQVILLYYFEDLTLDRIASRLGVTKSYVARVHQRALPELARRLKKVGAEYGLVEDAQ